jgi:F-type H+-transporting ATPase subunit epsilon
MYLEIISPEKTLYEGDVLSVVLPGTDGSFGVLKNHAAMISSLKEGSIKIIEADKREIQFEIKGGTAEVLQNNIIVLAE